MEDLVQIKLDGLKKAEWLDERDRLIAELADIESVESDSDLTVAGTLQTKASKHLKILERDRKAVKAPVTKLGKDIDAYAKTLRLELEEGIARVKNLNNAYATKKVREAEAERMRIAEEFAAKVEAVKEQPQATFGGVAVELDVPQTQQMDFAPLPTGKVNTGANAMVKVWEFQIINELEVPREFLTIDESKIREFMKYKTKMGETPVLAGIKFESRMDVRSR